LVEPSAHDIFRPNAHNARMKSRLSLRGVSWCAAGAACCIAVWIACSSSDSDEAPGASVLQHHNHANRDGLYVDAAFTKAAAAQLHIDPSFHASIEGPTYAQPLYLDRGSGGADLVLAVTEQNRVYALDATTGSVVWQTKLGEPVSRSALPCGDIDTVGMTGTPVIDFASKTLFVAAMVTPDGGTTKKHLVFALSIDDGSTRSGWPLDVEASVKFGATAFQPTVQNQRSALALFNGTLYVAYGGHTGDCGDYRGWVVGIPLGSPSSAQGFATGVRGGGIWAPGGFASDGTSLFVATGNTFGTTTWQQGEAVLRFETGVAFSGAAKDYFTPSNWKPLDDSDADLGGTGPVIVDVPGATPSQLVVALGKNGVAYLLDRANLGGVGHGDGTMGEGITSAKVASGSIINAAAAYTTTMGTYVVVGASGTGCASGSGDLTAIKISAASPPQITVAWCAQQNGRGAPIVTTTDGRSDAIIWSVGAEGANRLVGFDGDTGQVVFAGGGAAEALPNIRRFSTPIVAKGRIFVASDSAVHAFTTH